MHTLLVSLGAAALLGVVMTAGDFVWAHFAVRHTMWKGIVHGAVMCLFIGAVIGSRAGRIHTGLLAGPLVGVLAALAYYATARALGVGAMLLAWMLFWICFALLQRWLLHGPLRLALLRGVAAAVLSGLAFYAISGIWMRPFRGGPDFAIYFASWTVAFLPGFLALFFTRRGPHR